MAADDRLELEHRLSSLATRQDLREELHAEGERLRAHMTDCMKRVERKIDALIDAIELLKYIDSEARQHGTAPED